MIIRSCHRTFVALLDLNPDSVLSLLVNQHPNQTDGRPFLGGVTVADGNNLHIPVFSNKLMNPGIQFI